MGERRGTKGLELWCRRLTEGYPGVNVVNMTTSWRDGLAFCAIIHHFRPDLIDFSKLNKNDVYHNNELAFRVAERHLGIPALLEPEDMVEFQVPDRLSILTYLSQFYQVFGARQGNSPARIAPKRPTSSPDRGIVSPASTSPPTKVALSSSSVVGKVRREPCAKCNLPVFIAERLNVGKLLYHRTCFRCARCNSQLTLANYYETENNEFCCETCPDEEEKTDTKDASSVLTRSLSDEEKSASLKNKQETEEQEDLDDYSAKFESALEQQIRDANPQQSIQVTPILNSKRSNKARSTFMHSQVLDDGNFSDDEEPPDLPASKPPPLLTQTSSSKENLKNEKSVGDSGFPSRLESVNNLESSSVSSKLVSSGDDNPEDSHFVTKDAISAKGNSNSLVKARMRLFETKSDAHSVVNDKVPLTNSNSANSDFAVGHLTPNEDKSQHSFENNMEHNDKNDIISELDVKHEHKSDVSGDLAPETNNSVITISSEEKTITVDDNSQSSIIEISDELSKDASQLSDHENDQNEIETNKPEIETDLDNLKEKEEIELEVIENITDHLASQPEKEISENSSSALNENEEEVIYPDDLNPFGDEEEETKSKKSLNPFSDDEEDEEEAVVPSPRPATRKKVRPSSGSLRKVGLNPFEDDEDGESMPQPTKRKIVYAPKISLTPFWAEENDDKPIPKPRTTKSSVAGTPEPKPRESGLSINSSTTFGSTTSLSSSQSGTGYKKKKLAPRPPASIMPGGESGPSSLTSSPCHSVTQSPRATPKMRKNKKAPPPPMSTPADRSSIKPFDINLSNDFEKEKFTKDETNRNRQSQTIVSPTSSENSSSLSVPNKSTYGKWKRRKGQAPSRPIPQRRTIKSIPIADVKRELEIIEIQQQGLEKQGVRLEQIIREKCEGPHSDPDQCLSPEIEDMVLQLFELVNEKNELFRKQAELMYLRRQQRLEEEHADVEYQIRCLMVQPEANKTDSDKTREEELINRLVEIVERRNEIIECLEMDRVREAEEDDSINNQLNLYTMKKEEDKNNSELSNISSKKDKKKHKKEKQKNKNKGKNVDADKDIDESESPQPAVVKEKKDKKKHKKEKQKNKNKGKNVDADKDIDESESPQPAVVKEKKKKKLLNIF